MKETSSILWYFADPMCSWCWGFSPVLEKIKAHYGEQLKVALMLGGLRPGTREPMTPELREEILHHWHAVQKMTGQDFNFEGAMPDGFIYDTEPSSRAVIAVSEINPDLTLPYFKIVQKAFYVGQKDVADVGVLTELAKSFSIDPVQFVDLLNSEKIKKKTLLHFQYTRQADVRGFPTLVVQTGTEFKNVASGYRPFEDLKQDIDALLQERA